MCSTQLEATLTISSFSARMWWITVWGMCRRSSRALVEKCRSSSVTAQTVLILISMIDTHTWKPFFSHSDALFRYFGNVECYLCVVDSAIHSDPKLLLQLKHFHRWFVKNIEFDVNVFFILRIYNLYKNLKLTQLTAVKCSLINANSELID